MNLGSKLSVEDLDVKDKRVFVRVDFNVPQDATGAITNNARIVAALPTLRHLLEHGARTLVLGSHLGRPDGRVVPKLTLAPVAAELERLLGRPVTFVHDCVGAEAEAASQQPGVVLLENLRFHLEEEGKGLDAEGKSVRATPEAVAAFRAGLRRLADVYVDDAFGTAHRAHASMLGEGYAQRAAGFLVKRELDAFARVLESPRRPFLAIMGGAKVSDKIQLIRNMLDKVDEMIIGGGMAYTFLRVHYGMAIGNSLYDEAGAAIVEELLALAEEKGVRVHLPVDFVAFDRFAEDANTQVVTREQGIPDGWEGLDCGPRTRELFREVILRSATVVFNGPVGRFEWATAAEGTRAACLAAAEAAEKGAVVVIGGGDTATAAKNFGVTDRVTHVSTGGGVSLELLEGRLLPGVVALSDKE